MTSIAVAIATCLPASAHGAEPDTVAGRIEAAGRQEGAGDTAGAARCLAEVLAAPEGLDTAVRASVGTDLARLRLELGDYTGAMEAATTAAADAERGGDASVQASAEFMVGMVHRILQQYDEAGRAFRASARLARDSGSTDLYLQAMNEEGNVLAMIGDLEGALARKLEALGGVGADAAPVIVFSLENDTAFVYSMLGRPRDALPHFRRAWQLSSDLGRRREAAIVACNLAGCLASLGDSRSGIEWAERGLAIADTDDLLPAQETAHATLGSLLAQIGDSAAAVEHLQQAYELRERILGEDSARRIAELGSRHEAERREAEIELLRRDAEIRELELARATTQRRLMAGGLATLVAFVGVLASAYRIKVRANTEIRAANRALEVSRRRVEELSRTDALTGLANRRAIEERLDAEALRSERTGRSFAVVMADIDRFKEVNDRFGHDVGDHVLRALAQRLQGGVRAVDLAGRWGGEEFLLVLPDTDVDGARELAEKLRRAISAAPVTTDAHTIQVRATFGVAAHRGDRVDETVRRADEALYRGKREGRDRVAVG